MLVLYTLKSGWETEVGMAFGNSRYECNWLWVLGLVTLLFLVFRSR